AAALAAPEAGLTLIRIDPAAPYQLHVIASYLNGHPVRSESLDRRADQLQEEYDDLTERRDRLLEERRAVLGNFGQDPETVKRRQEYFRKEAELERAEQALRGRQERYLQLLRDLKGLNGVRVIANGLGWDEGYPVDGSGVLSRYLDDQPCQIGSWLQAAGD